METPSVGVTTSSVESEAPACSKYLASRMASAGSFRRAVWLFDRTSASTKHRAILLEHDLNGACNLSGHKISSRFPWYRTPLPKKVHCFLSGLSQHGPWLCFKDMRRLSATNTLYVGTFAMVSHDRGARVGHRLALGHPDRLITSSPWIFVLRTTCIRQRTSSLRLPISTGFS